MANKDIETYKLRCSFCAKDQHEVKKLVAGPGIYVCDECVRLCQKFMKGKPGQKAAPVNPVDLFKSTDSDALMLSLPSIERVRRDVGGQQQLVVDILRDRGVSWARIGDALDVSRQAVWRRFGSTAADT